MVDLPLPFSPTMTTSEEGAMVKDTFWRASCPSLLPGYLKVTFLREGSSEHAGFMLKTGRRLT